MFIRLLALPLALLFACSAEAADAPTDWSQDEFQFKFELHNPYEGAKSSPHSTVYLYIPAKTEKVRAFLLLQQNVVEQKISVHPAIRKVCDDNGIAIAWCTPGFNLAFTENGPELHDLIQREFGKFGASIGYPELGSAPLILFGHSNTTGYAQRGAEAGPDRVLAAIVTHGWVGVDSLQAYRGPVLVYQGQYMEQKQQGKSVVPNRGIESLGKVRRKLEQNWMPISVIEEYGAGHYDYSEPIVEFFAMYIDKAIEARLSDDGSLREIDPASGYIANLPGSPNGPIEIKPYAEASASEQAQSVWYFDREIAQQAAEIIAGNGPWNRSAQFIGFNNPDGTFEPFGRDGLVKVPYQIESGTNRIHFFPTLLDAVPADFNEGGQRVAQSSDPTITMEYECGPYIYPDPKQDGAYRIKLNRGSNDGYLVARNLGDDRTRPAVQPVHLYLGDRRVGDHRIPLPNLDDQHPGASVDLKDWSTGNVFVGYYVDHGPARVVDGKLEILPLPANTSGSLEVELVGYGLEQGVIGMSSTRFDVSR